MIEFTSNYDTPREVWQHLTSRLRRKSEVIEPEILQPVQRAWLPKSELERTVAAALLLAASPSTIGASPS
jgi:hypothetical protein